MPNPTSSAASPQDTFRLQPASGEYLPRSRTSIPGKRAGSLGNTVKFPSRLTQQGIPRIDRNEEQFALQDISRAILPNSATARCLIWRSREAKVTAVETGAGWKYTGLQTCASVWACPVCAAKISSRRSAEVAAGIAAWAREGGQSYLLTLTAPHYAFQSLAELKTKFTRALDLFNGGVESTQIRALTGEIGRIRNIEVTHGRRRAVSHGWHPHFHIVVFGRRGLDCAAIEARMFDKWAKACARVGLAAPSRTHGVRFEDRDAVANYLTKWGRELASSHTKSARGDGETPFDLLRAVRADREDTEAARLFKEFATTMKGAKQLVWSRGLADRFGINEASEEEAAAETHSTGDGDRVDIDAYWHVIKQRSARGYVLRLLNEGGRHALERWLKFIDTDSC